MPSYIQPRKYFTREEILIALRDRSMHRHELEKFFNQITERLIPQQRAKPTEGYTEAEITLLPPALNKRRFTQLLYHLKKDGLIAGAEHDKEIAITRRGGEWLSKYFSRPRNVSKRYHSSENEGARVVIISYDIPEKSRVYRDWLRDVLRRFGFTNIQQSVWVGKIKLPEDFIKDISRYKLEKFIEIFEITKQGTLRNRL